MAAALVLRREVGGLGAGALKGLPSNPCRMPATRPGDGLLGPADGQGRAGLHIRLFRMTETVQPRDSERLPTASALPSRIRHGYAVQA